MKYLLVLLTIATFSFSQEVSSNIKKDLEFEKVSKEMEKYEPVLPKKSSFESFNVEVSGTLTIMTTF